MSGSVCPACGAPAVHSEWTGWVWLPDQDARLSTLARLETEKRLKAVEDRAWDALVLVREAGDCLLLSNPGQAMERISQASVILLAVSHGRA